MNIFNNLSSMKYLLANKLTADDLTKEVEYLISNFLVVGSLNMIYAKAGMGKSFFTLSLSLALIKSRSIKQCIYLDADNSLTALKSRGIDLLIEKYPELIYIHSSKFDISPQEILNKLSTDAKQNSNAFEDTLFIFDSIRDYIGGDMNSDRDIIKIMQQLKDLREAGATIIYLHHTTKDSDTDTPLFKGSTSFIDSVDCAFSLSSKRTENRLNYQLLVTKDRLSVEDCAFELDTTTMILQSENMQIAQLSEYEIAFVEKVQESLKFWGKDGVKQTHLLRSINKSSDDKTARKYLQKFNGEFWKIEKRPQENNASYYFPLSEPNLPNLPLPQSA
ncbi:MAG: helicase RepA family protein [Sulfurimonas sp.]|nr:helicase RepA family protein [Sulfurimonas sp.]